MLLKIKNLDFKYDNSNQLVFDKFSLSLEEGKILSLLGKSGCGKSTLLRIIGGLEYPLNGEILIKEKVLVDNKTFIQPEKREIGFMFQDYALFPHMTVFENISFGLLKMSKEEKRKRVLEVLKLVKLEGFEKRYPHELSGGQQQRIALARALAPKPKLLLMDEPFSNLDSDLRKDLRIEIKRILREENITCIFVTHDKEDAEVISDEIYKITK